MTQSTSNPVANILERRAATLNPDRSRLSARVADLIARTILEEDLQPGDRLPPERQMLEQFGIGRASLREALRLLEADGLVRMRMGPSGGPEVAYPQIDQITRILLLFLITSGATLRDIYIVRSTLDPAVAFLAATGATQDDVDLLEEAKLRMRAAVNKEPNFLQENGLFHRLIAEMCGNPLLTAMSLSMLSILDGHDAGIRYSLAARRSVAALHEAIADAIIARDGEAASEAAAHHVETAIAYFEKRYPKSLDEPLNPSTFRGYSTEQLSFSARQPATSPVR
jgi:DNA-binding FadR family transcriptional regulator